MRPTLLRIARCALCALLLIACDADPDGGMGPDAADGPDGAAVDVGMDAPDAPDTPDWGEIDLDLPDSDLDSGDFDPDMGELDADFPPEGGMTPDLAPPDAEPTDPDAAEPDAEPDLALPDLALPDLALPDLGPPREQCFGGVDDDGDGLIDCSDPDCRPSPACFEAREVCDNGIDDDGDGRVDCDDRYCLDDDRCPAPDVEPFTTEELQARFDVDCEHCHGPVDPFSSLDLSAPFEDAVVGVLSIQVPMDLIKAGDRQQSFLYQKMVWRHLAFGGDGDGMPPAADDLPPWSAADAERLGRWIDTLQP